MGWTLEQLGDRVGMVKSAVFRFENGNNAMYKMSQVVALAKAVGVDPAWLMGISDDPRPRPSSEETKSMKWIPLLGTISAGLPLYAVSNIEHHLAIRSDSDVQFGLRVKGDSMKGACIHDGSIVLCREQPEVENGQIAICIVDDEDAMIKRYHRYENGIVALRSENPNYQDIVFTPKEARSLRIIGRAVMVVTELK